MLKPQEMSNLVYEWELEAGESFYEYSGLLSESHQVIELVSILRGKDLIDKDGFDEVMSDTFPEVITIVSNSRAMDTGAHEDYMQLLDEINAFILTQDLEEYNTFKRHYVTGMEPSKSKVYQEYMRKGSL